MMDAARAVNTVRLGETTTTCQTAPHAAHSSAGVKCGRSHRTKFIDGTSIATGLHICHFQTTRRPSPQFTNGTHALDVAFPAHGTAKSSRRSASVQMPPRSRSGTQVGYGLEWSCIKYFSAKLSFGEVIVVPRKIVLLVCFGRFHQSSFYQNFVHCVIFIYLARHVRVAA